jgi:ketosteroid isomerase-like protein
MQGQTGHDTASEATFVAVERFNDAFNRQDMEALMALVTDDCVFENTYPPPDGARFAGREAVRAAWAEFFGSSPHATFESEDLFACGDRAVVRWLYRWVDANGRAGHIRGVDVMRVRNGKVAEKLAYVKG